MTRNVLLLCNCLAFVFLLACGGVDHRTYNTSTASPSPTTAARGPAAAVEPRSYPGVGVVIAINPKAPSIEINHGDIEGLMPAMQMEFEVSDASLLNGLQVNDQIEFTIEDRTGVMRVTAIKKKL
ncbi:MAG TPA: copper-binding protein [Pyrinomonadaceae bacterium]|nr:copper-binding protein [Pyrinomonadaceae bacterium]